MEFKATISVIIPVYNVDKYLAQCLNSVVSQNTNNIEIIVINDASTDKSLSIIKDFKIKNNSIQLINYKTNKGVGNVRNIGIQKASGEYIFFIDSDDYLELNAFDLLLDKINKENYDVVCFGFRKFRTKNDKSDEIITQKRELFPDMREGSMDSFENVLTTSKGFAPMVWSYLFNREFLLKNQILFPSNIFFEDVPFTTKSLFYCKRLGVINHILYNYRFHRFSITTSNSKKKIDDSFTAHFLIKQFLEKEKVFDKYYKEYLIRILTCCISPCFTDFLKLPKKNKDIELIEFMSKVRKSSLLSASNLALLKSNLTESEKSNLKHEYLFLKKAYNFLVNVRHNYTFLSFTFRLRRVFK